MGQPQVASHASQTIGHTKSRGETRSKIRSVQEIQEDVERLLVRDDSSPPGDLCRLGWRLLPHVQVWARRPKHPGSAGNIRGLPRENQPVRIHLHRLGVCLLQSCHTNQVHGDHWRYNLHDSPLDPNGCVENHWGAKSRGGRNECQNERRASVQQRPNSAQSKAHMEQFVKKEHHLSEQSQVDMGQFCQKEKITPSAQQPSTNFVILKSVNQFYVRENYSRNKAILDCLSIFLAILKAKLQL